MEQEIIMILALFIIFLLTGLFGGLGVYSLIQKKKKQAIWSFSLGFLFVVIYLAIMFLFELI